MSNYITVWVILTTILSVPEILIFGQQQQVPCLFLFGDELFDNGNNNGLITTAKANYPPYGIDYPGTISTGRFTNADNTADYLAKLLGFNASIPPYATRRRSGSNVLRGLNYASGGYGILSISGTTLLDDGFSMDEQLFYHEDTIMQNEGFQQNQTATKEYLSQCLYAVSTGSNDYINNYYQQPISLYRLSYSPKRFSSLLLNRFSFQLRRLYSVGARKVAVFGVGLIGCIPQELALYPPSPTNGSACVDDINRAVRLFNDRLVSLIVTLNTNLPNARFTYINATNIAMEDPSNSLVGLKVLNAPCCEVQQILGPGAGRCVRNGAVCSNRNEYAFFDNINPTQIVINVTASRSYNALSPADAFPVDIRTLVNQ